MNNRDVERAYTATQGQYLGFIYYNKTPRRSPRQIEPDRHLHSSR
ncbi:MAG: hypothetical protein WCK27_18955 [Verrucomicrobiota bacterium]